MKSTCFSCDEVFELEDQNDRDSGYFCDECLINPYDAATRWFDKGLTPTKGECMEMTEESFARVIAMRDELIFKQKDEIAKLNSKINRLEQKIKSKRG